MRKHLDQRGSTDPLLIPLVIAVVLLVGIAGFGLWSYTNYLDANKVEQAEIDEAVETANAKLTEDLELAFAQREKTPTRVYTTPQSSGSVAITYPKTWSVYTEENDERGVLETYAHPAAVKNIKSDAPMALKMTINTSSYSAEAKKFSSNLDKGLYTIKAFEALGVTGIRVDGNIIDDFEGSLVMFPLRDKTVTIWTENNAYLGDFNDIVIKKLSFVP